MSSEDSYLDLEGSDDEDSHQILSTHEGSSQMDKNPSTISNKTEDGSDKSATTPSGPAICGFCHKPSTLKIGGKSYLCNSRTMPHLRICNACKSYEYRHGILIDRDQRKNKSRKRRIDGDGPSRKRQYYDPVEENPQEIESEPELYPFARTDTPAKKIRTLPKPPAALRIPVFEASPKERNCLDPRLAKIEKEFGYPQEPKKELVSFAIEDHMDIEGDSDNDDLGCEQCKKPITSVSQLIMCGGCDKIFHKDCYALARSDYTILRSNSYGFRCLTISCADHEFTKRIRKEKPRSLPPLTIVDTKEPSRPNLTLSDLCFESIEETDVVITPDYVNQLYNYKNFVEEDESSLQQLDRQKMDMINPYLFGSNL
jgi:hypothetical protein